MSQDRLLDTEFTLEPDRASYAVREQSGAIGISAQRRVRANQARVPNSVTQSSHRDIKRPEKQCQQDAIRPKGFLDGPCHRNLFGDDRGKLVR